MKPESMKMVMIQIQISKREKGSTPYEPPKEYVC